LLELLTSFLFNTVGSWRTAFPANYYHAQKRVGTGYGKAKSNRAGGGDTRFDFNIEDIPTEPVRYTILCRNDYTF
jgi:hypothetical protein